MRLMLGEMVSSTFGLIFPVDNKWPLEFMAVKKSGKELGNDDRGDVVYWPSKLALHLIELFPSTV